MIGLGVPKLDSDGPKWSTIMPHLNVALQNHMLHGHLWAVINVKSGGLSAFAPSSTTMAEDGTY